MIEEELVKRLTLLERQVDGLIKPEVPLGLSRIADTTLAASATSITFSSISPYFTNLMIISFLRSDVAAENDGVLLRFNADATAIYDWERLTANSATVTGLATRAATSIQFGLCEGANSRALNWSPTWGMVYRYGDGGSEKWTISYNAGFGDISADADLILQFRGGRWRSPAAITSLTLLPLAGANFVTGSRVQLYGVM